MLCPLRQERQCRPERDARGHDGANDQHSDQQHRRTDRAEGLAERVADEDAEIATRPFKVMVRRTEAGCATCQPRQAAQSQESEATSDPEPGGLRLLTVDQEDHPTCHQEHWE